MAQDVLGVEIVDVDTGPGIDGHGQDVAGPVARDVDRVDAKIIGTVGHVTGDLILPVAVAIDGEHGQNLALQAQGDGGAGLPLALQQRGGVAGQIVHLAGAGVALVAQVEGDGGDGVEQGLAEIAGPVACRILGIGLDAEGAVHQLAGDVTEIGLPDEAGQHHSGGGEAIAILIDQGNGDGLAHLDVFDGAADDDPGGLVGIDDVVQGLGFGDGDLGDLILIFHVRIVIALRQELVVGIKPGLGQGGIVGSVHHHEAAGTGADDTATGGGGSVAGRGLFKHRGRVGPLADGLLQAGQLGIHRGGLRPRYRVGLSGFMSLAGGIGQLESPIGFGEQTLARLQLHPQGGTARGAIGIHDKHGALQLRDKGRFLDSQLSHISSNS
ncbi:hypothetical protein D3C79_538360 [compost metagenome]